MQYLSRHTMNLLSSSEGSLLVPAGDGGRYRSDRGLLPSAQQNFSFP